MQDDSWWWADVKRVLWWWSDVEGEFADSGGGGHVDDGSVAGGFGDSGGGMHGG